MSTHSNIKSIWAAATATAKAGQKLATECRVYVKAAGFIAAKTAMYDYAKERIDAARTEASTDQASRAYGAIRTAFCRLAAEMGIDPKTGDKLPPKQAEAGQAEAGQAEAGQAEAGQAEAEQREPRHELAPTAQASLDALVAAAAKKGGKGYKDVYDHLLAVATFLKLDLPK